MAFVDYDPSQWRLYLQLEIQLQQQGIRYRSTFVHVNYTMT